jgi:NAD(P)-dependent dehydrogenase (short-subunit alcohol dehydrogenase family)
VSNVLSSTEHLTLEALQDGLWQHSMEHFTESFHVNVTGAFYTAVAFLDLLAEGNARAFLPQTSQVIITTSLGGFSRRPAASFAYGSSKAAAGHLAKQLATFLAPYKIRVNAIAPGFYPSEMTDNLSLMKSADNPRLEGSIPNTIIPLERVGSEEDMAGVVLFLASRAGSYIDGTVLLTDGGRGSLLPTTY